MRLRERREGGDYQGWGESNKIYNIWKIKRRTKMDLSKYELRVNYIELSRRMLQRKVSRLLG